MTSKPVDAARRACKIMILQGDHIGPEIMAEVLPLFDFAKSRYGVEIELIERLIGGACLDQHDCPFKRARCRKHPPAMLFYSGV